jgi:hypothetical protein
MRKTPIFVLADFMAVFEALIVALAPHRMFADEAAMPVKECPQGSSLAAIAVQCLVDLSLTSSNMVRHA